MCRLLEWARPRRSPGRRCWFYLSLDRRRLIYLLLSFEFGLLDLLSWVIHEVDRWPHLALLFDSIGQLLPCFAGLKFGFVGHLFISSLIQLDLAAAPSVATEAAVAITKSFILLQLSVPNLSPAQLAFKEYQESNFIQFFVFSNSNTSKCQNLNF